MLTKYLKDFSVPVPAPVTEDILSSFSPSGLSDLDFSEPEPAIDIEAERQQAHEEGYREATAHCEAVHAEEMQALRETHAAEVKSLSETHESETVWVIHARFHEMTEAIAQTIAEQTLHVLMPVFDEEITRRAIEHLSELVKTSLLDGDVSTVTVRGPQELYDRLKPMLEIDGVETRFIENSAPDISVEINESVLVTRLSSWAQALSEVSG